MAFPTVSAYEEFTEFIATPPTLEDIAELRLSDSLEARISALLEANRTRALNAGDQSELDEYMRVEHLMRMAKTRALAKLRRI